MQKEKSRFSQPANRFYTVGEEIANSVTHGIGTVLSVIGMTVLLILAAAHDDKWPMVGFSIYGSSLIILYLASTLYHSIQHPRARRVLRIFDHAAIYLLIAGSYTPFALVTVRGPLGWTILALIWFLALLGILFKVWFIGRFEVIATIAYVLMGWLGLIAFKQLVAGLGLGGMIWLLMGGLAYTCGVLFYAWHKLPYHHAIWHLFVLGGSTCHFFAVLFHVLPAA